MVPSLLAKQPRRSARRPPHTSHSHSRSTLSLSPTTTLHFPPINPPSPQSPSFPLSPLNSHSTFLKRVKQEPHDTTNYLPLIHSMDDATHPTTNGRAKRKPKDKVELVLPAKVVYEPATHEIPVPDHLDDNDDDGGITRCVCGRTELDADEDENGVMVMCETCKVWQHAVCVNLNEDTTEQDYYCEQCRPDLHVDLLKSLKKRSRHHHAQHHRRPSASVPRSSRSHSPGHVLTSATSAKSQPKRRNTMNSRDADYEESVKQLIESTRPDAERHPDHDKDDLAQYEEPGVIIEIVSGARKKRKRQADKENDKRAVEVDKTENSGPPHKRQRSNSATPDQNFSTTTTHNTTNGATTNGTTGSRHASTPSGPTGPKPAIGVSKKRGRKEPVLSGDPDGSSKKHPNQYTYRKGAAPTPPKRPGLNGTHSTASHPGTSSNAHDHGTRRNAHVPHAPPAPQPLLTSWGLPDYLAHLASELPTDVPRPVEVRILDVTPQDGSTESVANSTGAGEDHTVLERGVKVKWPAKRTSVGDMNKRVRGIIDWVGREQAMALDRRRRREALRGQLLLVKPPAHPPTGGGEGEDAAVAEKGKDEASANVNMANANVNDVPVVNAKLLELLPESEATHLMEELMKELIAFQEKFGPGAKGKERRAAG